MVTRRHVESYALPPGGGVSSTVLLAALLHLADAVNVGVVDDDGTAVVLPDGWTSTRDAVGIYSVSTSAPLPAPPIVVAAVQGLPTNADAAVVTIVTVDPSGFTYRATEVRASSPDTDARVGFVAINEALD